MQVREKVGVSESEANANLRNLGLRSCQKSELHSVQDQVKANMEFLIPSFYISDEMCQSCLLARQVGSKARNLGRQNSLSGMW